MFYDKYAELCKRKGVKPSPAAVEAGISKSLVTKWKTNKTAIPSPEVLSKLSKYFSVPVSELIEAEEYNPVIYCDGCGIQYNSLDLEEIRQHTNTHKRWEAAVKHFGFCWEQKYREEKKEIAREIVENDKLELSYRVNAQVVVFKALFSRSLASNDFDLVHPDFNSYVSMILWQGKERNSIPVDVYDALVNEYGTQEGIPEGTYYYVKKRAPLAMSYAEKELSNYYNLTDENKKKAQEYIDLLLNSQ